MKRFNLVLLQDVKKGDVVNTRELKARFQIKKNETPLAVAIELTRLLAITRNEQMIAKSKFKTPFNLGSTFKIGIEMDNELTIYEGAKNGLQFIGNSEQVRLSFAVKEQMSKGEVVATECEVFTKRAELIAKQIYLTLCQALDVPHGLKIGQANDINKLMNVETQKVLN